MDSFLRLIYVINENFLKLFFLNQKNLKEFFSFLKISHFIG